MRILVNTSALALLMLASAAPAPGFAQSNNGATVTIFRGGTNSSAASTSTGMGARAVNGVTIMTGTPLLRTAPQQTAELPGAALATGNGVNANAALGAGAANSGGTTSMGNAALGAGAGATGGTIAAPARSGFARPSGGGARGGFGFK
jgi:hypothetical protein